MTTSTLAEPGAAQKLSAIAHGYVAASALHAILRLSIAELLHPEALPVEDLALKSSCNKDALCRVLRLLCCLGIFEETAAGVFANNEASNLLRADSEGSCKDLLLFSADPLHFKAYADMLPVIKDGRTASEHVWGKGIFDVFAEDPAEQKVFDNAMSSFSRQALPEILRVYDFSGIKKLVDVAGGHGSLLSNILIKYPDMHGVLFDLPQVAAGAETCIKKLGLEQRCQVVSGDFFKSVPEGDAIIMKHIIHDWNDEKALIILKNCREALSKSSSGKLLIVEMLMAGMNELHPSKFLDIEMLMLPGGRERTEQEFAELFEKAGLKLKAVFPTKGPWAVLEAELL